MPNQNYMEFVIVMATTKQAAFQNPILCMIISVALDKNLQQRMPSIRNNYTTYMPNIAENTFFFVLN